MHKLQYEGYNGGRGPSAAIWGDCPWLAMLADPNVGYTFWDDFVDGGLTPTITTWIGVGRYSMFGSSGATVTFDDAAGGGIVLSETTDDESVGIATEQHPFRLTRNGGKLWFEGRIKVSHTATTESAIFLGLGDTTNLAAAVPLTASAGALADMNLVGFHKLDTDLTELDCSYKADGVTAVKVNDQTITIAAATYIKLGMKFDPSDGYLRFYADGVEQASKKLLPDATGTDFPADIGLGPCVAMHLGAAASDNTLTMDWWRCAQLCV